MAPPTVYYCALSARQRRLFRLTRTDGVLLSSSCQWVMLLIPLDSPRGGRAGFTVGVLPLRCAVLFVIVGAFFFVEIFLLSLLSSQFDGGFHGSLGQITPPSIFRWRLIVIFTFSICFRFRLRITRA